MMTANPGEVLCADNRLVVCTGAGSLELIEIQMAGKRRLPVEEFMRGYNLSVGDHLG